MFSKVLFGWWFSYQHNGDEKDSDSASGCAKEKEKETENVLFAETGLLRQTANELRAKESSSYESAASESSGGGEEKSAVSESNSDVSAEDGYVCFMHRGAVVSLDCDAWTQAKRLHIETKRKVISDIECGPDSNLTIVEFAALPDDCAYLRQHKQYVIKKLYCSIEQRLHECRTLRALADRVDRNAQHFALPLEMWFDSALNVYSTLTPKRPCDVFDFMRVRAHKRPDRQLRYETVGIIIEQVAQALQILHDDYAIAHNDIKPENVLIDPSTMQCWLCDFGGAVMLNEAQQDCFIQTLLYASPERHQRRKCDKSTDIWSLGIMAAEVRRARDLTELVDEERWFELLRQPQQIAKNKKNTPVFCANEWLDEPGVFEALVDSEHDLAEPFFALLRRTVRHCPANRSTATEILCAKDCEALFKHGRF